MPDAEKVKVTDDELNLRIARHLGYKITYFTGKPYCVTFGHCIPVPKYTDKEVLTVSLLKIILEKGWLAGYIPASPLTGNAVYSFNSPKNNDVFSSDFSRGVAEAYALENGLI